MANGGSFFFIPCTCDIPCTNCTERTQSHLSNSLQQPSTHSTTDYAACAHCASCLSYAAFLAIMAATMGYDGNFKCVYSDDDRACTTADTPLLEHEHAQAHRSAFLMHHRFSQTTATTTSTVRVIAYRRCGCAIRARMYAYACPGVVTRCVCDVFAVVSRKSDTSSL